MTVVAQVAIGFGVLLAHRPFAARQRRLLQLLDDACSTFMLHRCIRCIRCMQCVQCRSLGWCAKSATCNEMRADSQALRWSRLEIKGLCALGKACHWSVAHTFWSPRPPKVEFLFTLCLKPRCYG